MSVKTEEIVQRIKSLTTLEVAALVKELEETFRKDSITHADEPPQFNVLLEGFSLSSRREVQKVVRKITKLGFQRSKDLIERVPSIIKSAIALEEAAEIKQHLEAAGATVSILSKLKIQDTRQDLINVLDGSRKMNFNLVLEYYPPVRKIAVLREVRQITGLGLKEAKDLIERIPSVIKSAIAFQEAAEIKQHLEAAGAKVSILSKLNIQDARQDLIAVLDRSRKMQFNVVLENYPLDRKILVLKEVRQITGFGLKETKDLIESAPTTIKSAIAFPEAEKIKQHLEAAGAKVSIL